MRVQQLLQLLSQADHELTERLAAILADDDCIVERWRVLELLADRKGHPMTEIARYVMLPSPSLTRLIDAMVTDNLVHRRVDRDDRRRVLVHITPRGTTLRRRLANRIEHQCDFILAGCHREDLAALGDALARLLQEPPRRPSSISGRPTAREPRSRAS